MKGLARERVGESVHWDIVLLFVGSCRALMFVLWHLIEKCATSTEDSSVFAHTSDLTGQA